MPSLEELMAAFSNPPRPSLLKGHDAEAEAAFRQRIAQETDGHYGNRDPAPSSLPVVVPIPRKGGR